MENQHGYPTTTYAPAYTEPYAYPDSVTHPLAFAFAFAYAYAYNVNKENHSMAKEPKTTPAPEPKTDPNTIPPPGEQSSGIPVYEQSEDKDEGGEPETAAEKAGKKNPADKDEDEDTASS